LNTAGFGTLLLDLWIAGEQTEPADLFAWDALAQRLVAATNWLRTQPETARLALGYLGRGRCSTCRWRSIRTWSWRPSWGSTSAMCG
jgi:hypothetical protein